MKKFLAIAFAAMMSLGTMAQTAQQVLDKTAAIVGNKNGASASFKLSSPKYGSTSGSIAIKGNKFNARTPQAIVWYNGKTQWSYMKKTNEVNLVVAAHGLEGALVARLVDIDEGIWIHRHLLCLGRIGDVHLIGLLHVRPLCLSVIPDDSLRRSCVELIALDGNRTAGGTIFRA